MRDRILHLFNLRPGEAGLAFALLTILAVNTVVLELSDVVATAGFVSNLGAVEIPYLWIVDMVVSLFAASALALAIDQMPRLRLLSWLLGGMAVVYLLLHLFFRMGIPDRVTYSVLYVLADLQFMLFPLAFWTMANDVYSMTETKRLLPVIGAGVAIGSIGGNLLASGAAVWLTRHGGDTTQIFLLSAVLLLISLAILRLVFRGRPIRARQARADSASNNLQETIQIGADYFLHLPLFRYLGIAMLLIGLALTIIEYHLLATMEQTFATGLQFQAFYGFYKTLFIIALLFVQSFVTGRLLQKVPLENGFVVLPVTLLAASGGAMIVPGLIGAAAARFVARLVERAWDEPTRKATQGLVPDERRGRVSTFLDTYFYTLATILGSVLLLILFQVATWNLLLRPWVPTIYLFVAGAAAAGAIGASLAARATYGSSLLNWRLARARRKSALDGIEF